MTSKNSKIFFGSIALMIVALGIAVVYMTRASGNYYVDCSAGADTNSGNSETSAWKTLAKAGAATLVSGDKLLLKRGCTWNETLNANWSGTSSSPITIGAYGTGDQPIITSAINGKELVAVGGSYLVIENIYAKAGVPAVEAGCQNNPKGYIVGFSFKSGATYNTLRNSKATGGYAGVFVKSGSHHNKIHNNQFLNNIMMNPLDTATDNDAGAFGVLIHGDDNETNNNEINGQYACSYDYNGDGAAVELYGGQRNYIHHNKAQGNEAFTELGNSRTSDTTYAYNEVWSSIQTSTFLITRGSGSGYGPVNRTKVFNNTVYLNGAVTTTNGVTTGPQGVVCHAGCSAEILTLKNNILWANWKSIYADAAFDEGYNVYWKTGGSPLVQGFTMSSTSQKADPKFADVAIHNLHLLTGSPAIDKGTSVGYTTDLDGFAVPAGSAPDVGAYEFGSSGTTPPPPPPTDTTDPTVSITAPANGATVTKKATVTIAATASDDVGVTKVEFYINGSLACTDTASAYSCAWKVPAGKSRTYTISVKAYDAAGRVGTSSISVKS